MKSDKHYKALMREFKVIKDRLRGVVHGHNTGLYLHGRPGTSKTHLVRSTLDTLAVGYSYANGQLTPIGLFDLLAENADRIIVLDDVSSTFNQPVALQFLLAALGNSYDGSGIRKIRYKKSGVDQEIQFSGGIIAISNLPLTGHHHEVLAALNDRVNVISFEPSDAQIIALIRKIAGAGIQGVAPKTAQMVATFLFAQCAQRDIRPSVRLFVDKALKDFKLHESGKSETHWRDLVVSNLEQQLVELQYPTTDLSRDERIESERRIALEVVHGYESLKDRVDAWKSRTGKGQSALYRRLTKLKRSGQL